MNYKMMGRIFAEILALEAFFMLPPLFISIYDGVDVAAKAFLYTIGNAHRMMHIGRCASK